MSREVKFFLFILALPLLILCGAIFLLPVLFFLLVLIIFMPSVRIFQLFQSPRTENRKRASQEKEKPAGEEIIDVECTVSETIEDPDTPENGTTSKQDR